MLQCHNIFKLCSWPQDCHRSSLQLNSIIEGVRRPMITVSFGKDIRGIKICVISNNLAAVGLAELCLTQSNDQNLYPPTVPPQVLHRTQASETWTSAYTKAKFLVFIAFHPIMVLNNTLQGHQHKHNKIRDARSRVVSTMSGNVGKYLVVLMPKAER